MINFLIIFLEINLHVRLLSRVKMIDDAILPPQNLPHYQASALVFSAIILLDEALCNNTIRAQVYYQSSIRFTSTFSKGA